MAVYFAYQILAGSILHLIVLGIVMELILVLFCGVSGKGFQALAEKK